MASRIPNDARSLLRHLHAETKHNLGVLLRRLGRELAAV
jgi:hypothetical protein